jgi:acyl-CoA reductase-like NAD-dependent aldehyde dehydrogenase
MHDPGSRIFVQSGIYDKFLEKFTEKSKSIRIGDPFGSDIDQGPMSSEAQFNVGDELNTLRFIHKFCLADYGIY